MMSFDPNNSLDVLLLQWFDAIESFYDANRELMRYVAEHHMRASMTPGACKKKLQMYAELAAIATHADLTLEGMRYAGSTIPTFHHYMHVNAQAKQSLENLFFNEEPN